MEMQKNRWGYLGAEQGKERAFDEKRTDMQLGELI